VSYNFSLGSPAVVNAATIHSLHETSHTITEAKGQMLREMALGEAFSK
jgi:hypothetical protein